MKNGPLSRARAREVPWVCAVRRWFPLPLHPIVAGIAMGFIPGVPASPGIENPPETVFYYGGAGVLAVLWRNLYREWKKYRDRGALPPD